MNNDPYQQHLQQQQVQQKIANDTWQNMEDLKRAAEARNNREVVYVPPSPYDKKLAVILGLTFFITVAFVVWFGYYSTS